MMYHEKNTMFADTGMTEGWSSPIVAPDTMTPDQFFGQLRRQHQDPIHALLIALLEDGTRDYQTAVGRENEPRSASIMVRDRNAKAWIAGADARITFEDCCDAFGINPEWLRAGIMASKPTRRLRRGHIVKGSVAA